MTPKAIIGTGEFGSRTFDKIEKEAVYQTNSNYWNEVGSDFLGTIALPLYGAFVSEEKLQLLGDVSGKKVLEIHFSKYFRLQQQRGGVWWLADKWRTWKDQKYIRQYDKFVVLTHEDKTYWGNPSNIEVIHNACTFAPSEQAALTSKRAIAVGRLTPQKGFDMLIDAWQQVTTKHPDWQLTIIGGGEEKETRERQIIGLGLQDTVQIYPPTQHIERELLDSALYILSSRYEGLPMILLEAMSCGLPAVSFACKCGPRDVIEDRETGLLISPGDVAALAEGICRLIEDEALRIRMGHRAAQDVQERFATERIMNQWEALFFTLCHESNI